MTGKAFLVVGGTHGIGSATAKRLAQAGHAVWACGRTQPDPAPDDGIDYFQLDVLDSELDFSSVPDALDGFVYCPGTITLKPIRGLKEAEFRSDWELNFMGAVRCTQALLPRLKKAKPASIVFFSTVAVQQGMPFHTSIAAAKGAIEAFTRSLAAELAPEVRVNCVAPSLTQTRLAERLLSTDQRREDAASRHPLRRYGVAEEIAAVAAFLASDDTAWMTGQIVAVDGGLSTLRV